MPTYNRPTAPGSPARGGVWTVPLVALTAGLGLCAMVAGGVGVWWFVLRAPAEVAAPAAPPNTPSPSEKGKSPPAPAKVTKPATPALPEIPATIPEPKATKQPPPPPVQPRPTTGEPPTFDPRARFTIRSSNLSFPRLSANGTRFAVNTDSKDGSRTEFWELSPTPKRITELEKGGTLSAISPDGRYVLRTIIGEPDSSTRVLDFATLALVSRLKGGGGFESFAGPDRAVSVVRPFVNDDPTITKRPVRVQLFDLKTGEKTSEFQASAHDSVSEEVPRIVAGGKQVALGWTQAQRLEVWDLESGKMLRGSRIPFAVRNSRWVDYEVSPDGERAMGVPEGTDNVTVFDIGTGAALSSFQSRPGAARNLFVAGRPDIVLAGRYRYTQGRDVAGFEAVALEGGKVLARFAGGMTTPVISADGTTLLARPDPFSPEYLVWDLKEIPRR